MKLTFENCVFDLNKELNSIIGSYSCSEFVLGGICAANLAL